MISHTTFRRKDPFPGKKSLWFAVINCFLEEVEIILYILKLHHPYITEFFKKETRDTSKTLESVDTDNTLLRLITK